MSSVVVVTGASSGVGRAIATAFGRRGARVGLLARSEEGLEGAQRDVEAAGGKALTVPTDVARPEQVEAAAAAVEDAFGPIDVWVNNAMVTVFAPFAEIEPEEFVRATEVTYLGTVWGTRAALSRMRPRNRGRIVLVGSALAYRGIPLQSPYCGAKHAIKGFFESIRTELEHDDSAVTICMIQLPGVNTPQFVHCRSKMPMVPMPVPPVYQPEVAAEAVVFAAGHNRRQMFVGAPAAWTIWGNRLAPWLADRYLAATGYKSQQSKVPAAPGRPDNLFDPSPRDPGAHGPYSAKAHTRSGVLWASMHRGGVAAAATLGALATGAGVLRTRRR
jgi:NAD(P)-dependent dehydrogenase (short-subunit alcohol dehydrogenase family)